MLRDDELLLKRLPFLYHLHSLSSFVVGTLLWVSIYLTNMSRAEARLFANSARAK